MNDLYVQKGAVDPLPQQRTQRTPRTQESLFPLLGHVFLAPVLDLRMHAPHAAIQMGAQFSGIVFRYVRE